jgi:hypothetical protein
MYFSIGDELYWKVYELFEDFDAGIEVQATIEHELICSQVNYKLLIEAYHT